MFRRRVSWIPKDKLEMPYLDVGVALSAPYECELIETSGHIG
jgi:hypothetical protein